MIELPHPQKVKETLTQLTRKVELASDRLGALAEPYGIRGNDLVVAAGRATLVLRICRAGPKWGVCAVRQDLPPDPITGCKVEEKCAFLRSVGELEEEYAHKVRTLFEMATKLL